MKTDQLAQ